MHRPSCSRTVGSLLVGVFAIMLAGCGLLVPDGCNLVACAGNGLIVTVDSAPPGPLTVNARVPNGPDTTFTASCSGDGRCTNTLLFGNLFASEVELTIITTAGIRVRRVRPVYQTSQPNGRSCPPTCRSGRVTVNW